jgi:polar amino acid transport system substrate-binding protein
MPQLLKPAYLFLVVILFALPVCAQDVKLGVAQREAVQDVAAQLLTEIYKRAGLTLRIDPYPAARLTDMVLKNEVDGEVSRIGIYFERNPSLIRVEPSYYYLITTAFARADRNISIGSIDELKKYRVGIIRGVYHAAKATEGVPGVVVVDEVTQLFKMLETGRIDIAIDVSLNGVDVISKLNLGSMVKPVGDIARRELFHVLIADKKDLAPKISTVIKSMIASRELPALTRRIEQSRLGNESAPDAPRRY